MGGDTGYLSAGGVCAISIHASRVGGDSGASTLHPAGTSFQSTPPGWEATGLDWENASRETHFNPRLPGGRRPKKHRFPPKSRNFNPRLPGGRRHFEELKYNYVPVFQSTPPGWEATALKGQIEALKRISIHASRVGGDLNARGVEFISLKISIHASRVGGDAYSAHVSPADRISIHASRVGGDCKNL